MAIDHSENNMHIDMHTDRPNDSAPADPLAAVTHPDPYPYYAAMARNRALVHDARLGLWMAAYPGLVRAVLAHPACLVRPVHEPVPARIAGSAGQVFGALARMNEGAPHAAAKAALAGALAALPPAAVASRTAEVAALLLPERASDAPALNRFVSALPVCTVASLLGFEEAQLPALAAWTGQFVACLSPLADDGQIARAHGAAEDLMSALHELAAHAPDAGLLALARAGEWPDAQAFVANLLGLLSQTYEATAGLLGNCLVALARGVPPGEVVAQTMRHDPAIHNTRRFTARPVRLGDATLPAGQTILLVLAAQGAQDGFGHGRHACPGQALAGAIVSAGVRALLARGALPRLSWRYRASLNARVPEFLENAP